jgi:hypothetical protein
MVQVIAGVAGEDLMGEGKAVTIDRKANAELLAVGAFINSSSNLSNRLAVSTALLHRDPHVLQVEHAGVPRPAAVLRWFPLDRFQTEPRRPRARQHLVAVG